LGTFRSLFAFRSETSVSRHACTLKCCRFGFEFLCSRATLRTLARTPLASTAQFFFRRPPLPTNANPVLSLPAVIPAILFSRKLLRGLESVHGGSGCRARDQGSGRGFEYHIESWLARPRANIHWPMPASRGQSSLAPHQLTVIVQGTMELVNEGLPAFRQVPLSSSHAVAVTRPVMATIRLSLAATTSSLVLRPEAASLVPVHVSAPAAR